MYEQILQKSLAIELFHSIPHRTFSHLTTTVTCIQPQLQGLYGFIWVFSSSSNYLVRLDLLLLLSYLFTSPLVGQ